MFDLRQCTWAEPWFSHLQNEDMTHLLIKLSCHPGQCCHPRCERSDLPSPPCGAWDGDRSQELGLRSTTMHTPIHTLRRRRCSPGPACSGYQASATCSFRNPDKAMCVALASSQPKPRWRPLARLPEISSIKTISHDSSLWALYIETKQEHVTAAPVGSA